MDNKGSVKQGVFSVLECVAIAKRKFMEADAMAADTGYGVSISLNLIHNPYGPVPVLDELEEYLMNPLKKYEDRHCHRGKETLSMLCKAAGRAYRIRRTMAETGITMSDAAFGYAFKHAINAIHEAIGTISGARSPYGPLADDVMTELNKIMDGRNEEYVTSYIWEKYRDHCIKYMKANDGRFLP